MRKMVLISIILVITLVSLPACSSGISLEEYEMVVANSELIGNRLKEAQANELKLEDENTVLEQQVANTPKLEWEISALKQQVSALQKENEELKVEIALFRLLVAQPTSENWEKEAAETELANVQSAVIAIMIDNELSEFPNPVIVATNDMSTFPDISVCGVDKILGPISSSFSERTHERYPYVRGGDKDGYIAYQHDIVADGKSVGLVDYLATQYSFGTYIVDSEGTVTQVTTGY